MNEILHVDMDAFFVSVEEVFDPSLKGKPLVVGGSAEGRGVVSAASYVARKFGIYSAMPIAKAKRLCSHAIFLLDSHRLYSEYSTKVFEILRRYSPLVEPMSLDEAFVDLTGCKKLHSPILKTAETIRNEIRDRLGLNASIGIATNKLMAKIASAYCKPNGMLWIAPGSEQQFLAPLPIKRIPGIDPKGCAKLNRMGVKSVADLSRLPLELLEARGISCSPVNAETEPPRSISRETTFATDSTDLLFLESTLSYLTEKTTAQLRSNGLFAKTVTLKLRYSDFKTVTRSQTLDWPTAADHKLLKTATKILRKLFDGRMQVRLIGISLSSLTAHPYQQEDLFDLKDSERWDGLYQGIDQIRKKYGFRSILRAASRRYQ